MIFLKFFFRFPIDDTPYKIFFGKMGLRGVFKTASTEKTPSIPVFEIKEPFAGLTRHAGWDVKKTAERHHGTRR